MKQKCFEQFEQFEKCVLHSTFKIPRGWLKVCSLKNGGVWMSDGTSVKCKDGHVIKPAHGALIVVNEG